MNEWMNEWIVDIKSQNAPVRRNKKTQLKTKNTKAQKKRRKIKSILKKYNFYLRNPQTSTGK